MFACTQKGLLIRLSHDPGHVLQPPSRLSPCPPSLGVQFRGDSSQGLSVSAELLYRGDNGLLVGVRFKVRAVSRESKPISDIAHPLAFAPLVLQGIARPLPDRLPFPLGNRRHDVDH